MSRFEKWLTNGSLAVFLVLSGLIAGAVVGHLRLWPTEDVLALSKQIEDYRRFGQWGRPNQFVEADVRAGDPMVRIPRPGDLLPGYRLIMGWDEGLETYSLRLLDETGAERHAWPISYARIAPDGPRVGDMNPHGLEVFPDGSIAVNFGGRARILARLDACGEVIWAARGIYHHSIHLDEDNRLWTWFSPDNIDGQYQNIHALDADSGAVLRDIDIHAIMAAAPENRLMLSVPQDYRFRSLAGIKVPRDLDLFHPNDVEPLTRAMAAGYPGFEAGDLMISLRHIDAVAILDPDSLEIKWIRHGPWRWQHDPDFVGDGLIEIYDNNPDRGRSNIIEVNLSTGAMRRRFHGPASHFYSRSQGKHQRLPNGASLITVPAEGRVIELTDAGEPVFVFNNVAGDGVNGRTLNAVWVPPDFYDRLPSCPG